MEIVSVSVTLESLGGQLPAPDPIFAGAQKTSFYEECERKFNICPPSRVAASTANTWLHRGKPYYDTQQHEYEELFRYLKQQPGFLSDGGSVLFVDTCPGQGIDEFVAADKGVHEWMACSLESSSVCPFLPHLQQAKHAKSGQACVFRPQVQVAEDAFTERHLFCILNAVGQQVNVVIIDATQDAHYDFHLQIALQRLQPQQQHTFFIWRVTTTFIYKQMALLKDAVIPNFALVQIATLKQHDYYDTHFIIARNRIPFSLEQQRIHSSSLELVINRLIDHWLDLARTEYNKFNALAAFMHAKGITNQDAADALWNTSSTMFSITQVLTPHNCTLIE